MDTAGLWEENGPLPASQGQGAAWGVPTQHPGHPSHQAQPSLCLGASTSATALAQGLGQAEPRDCSCKVFLLSAPTCSLLQCGQWGLASLSYPSTQDIHWASLLPCSCSEPWQPHCHSSWRIALEKAWGPLHLKAPTALQVTPVAAVPISLLSQTQQHGPEL